MDGVSQWKTILYDAPPLRSHILHNIDDQWGYAALRKENWKLVKGSFLDFFSFLSSSPLFRAGSVGLCNYFIVKLELYPIFQELLTAVNGTIGTDLLVVKTASAALKIRLIAMFTYARLNMKLNF